MQRTLSALKGVCWASVPPPSVTTFLQTGHQLGRLDVAGDGDPGFILFAAYTSAQLLSSEPSGRIQQRHLPLMVTARIHLLHLFLFFRWSKLEGPLDTTASGTNSFIFTNQRAGKAHVDHAVSINTPSKTAQPLPLR